MIDLCFWPTSNGFKISPNSRVSPPPNRSGMAAGSVAAAGNGRRHD